MTAFAPEGFFEIWVRSDYTGYEVMLGDMATFVAPEQTAEWSRSFFSC